VLSPSGPRVQPRSRTSSTRSLPRPPVDACELFRYRVAMCALIAISLRSASVMMVDYVGLRHSCMRSCTAVRYPPSPLPPHLPHPLPSNLLLLPPRSSGACRCTFTRWRLRALPMRRSVGSAAHLLAIRLSLSPRLQSRKVDPRTWVSDPWSATWVSRSTTLSTASTSATFDPV
jgi:hypothetical protein